MDSHADEATAWLADKQRTMESALLALVNVNSYTENAEVARRLIDLGYYISFSGIVTFRSAEPLRDCARQLPHDRVLIETDTPYLAPVPYRGKDNEPAFVVKVAELLAGLWSIPLEEVAEQTTRNFENAFGVSVAGRG